MKAELEENGPTVDEIGAVLLVKGFDGGLRYQPIEPLLRAPVALGILWRHTVAVLAPGDIVDALLAQEGPEEERQMTSGVDFGLLSASDQSLIAKTRLAYPELSTERCWNLLTRLKSGENEISEPEHGCYWLLNPQGTLSKGLLNG